MRLKQLIGLFFLFVIVGCYSFITVAAVCKAENNMELADFPFDSEEQEEESKEKEKEEREEKTKKDKEFLHCLNKFDKQIVRSQNRKCKHKHYSDLFIEVFTPPPEYIV